MQRETIEAIREVFKVPPNEPLVFEDKDRDATPWLRLWDKLFEEEKDGQESSSNLGPS